MTALQLDGQPLADAVLAAVDAALPDGQSAYEPDKVPGSNRRGGDLPEVYAVVHVRRRAHGATTRLHDSSTTGWRISVDAVGTTTWECRQVMTRAAQALHEVQLTLDLPAGGHLDTYLRFETEQHPEWSKDAGRYYASTDYICTT